MTQDGQSRADMDEIMRRIAHSDGDPDLETDAGVPADSTPDVDADAASDEFRSEAVKMLLTLRVPSDTLDGLADLAHARGIRVTVLAVEMIERALEAERVGSVHERLERIEAALAELTKRLRG